MFCYQLFYSHRAILNLLQWSGSPDCHDTVFSSKSGGPELRLEHLNLPRYMQVITILIRSTLAVNLTDPIC